jgi:transcriptional regulator
VLLVFQGPNGYISPAWYGESPSPPTWNFTAVHVRGIPEVLEGEEAFSVLERTVGHVEAAQDDPWELRGDALAYARRLAHELSPFRVRSAAIQAKAKFAPGQAAQDPGPRDRALEAGGPYRKRRSSGLSKTSYRSLCRAAARSRDRRAAVRVGKGRT